MFINQSGFDVAFTLLENFVWLSLSLSSWENFYLHWLHKIFNNFSKIYSHKFEITLIINITPLFGTRIWFFLIGFGVLFTRHKKLMKWQHAKIYFAQSWETRIGGLPCAGFTVMEISYAIREETGKRRRGGKWHGDLYSRNIESILTFTVASIILPAGTTSYTSIVKKVSNIKNANKLFQWESCCYRPL